MTVLTKAPLAFVIVPIRGFVLLLGVLNVIVALGVDSPLFAATRVIAGLFFMLVAVAPMRLALPAIAYAAVAMIFVRIRAFANDTAIPVHVDYPIEMEKFFLGGSVLNREVQELLYVPGRIGVLDVFTAVVYASYFVAPALASLVLWKVRPSLFPRLTSALILTLTLGLVIYFLVPTVPPWLASENGQIETVHRVMPQLTAVFAGDAYYEAAATLDKNPVAAMPSLHVALTVVIAAVMAQFGPWRKRAGIAYVASMCFALVYLGEHYVIDEVAGLALGIAVWRATGSLKLPSWSRRPMQAQEMEERVTAAPAYREAA